MPAVKTEKMEKRAGDEARGVRPGVLRGLCSKFGHLPESKEKTLSHANGGIGDIGYDQCGILKGHSGCCVTWREWRQRLESGGR